MVELAGHFFAAGLVIGLVFGAAITHATHRGNDEPRRSIERRLDEQSEHPLHTMGNEPRSIERRLDEQSEHQLHTSTERLERRRLPWNDADRKLALSALGRRHDELRGFLERATCCPSVLQMNARYSTLRVPPIRGCRAPDAGCLASARASSASLTIFKEAKVEVNGRYLSIDDIVQGYEMLQQGFSMYSTVTFLGIALQQDPLDAFAIGDLLWRVRPQLLIELGTAGGGSAFFYASMMRQYDPTASVRAQTRDVLSDVCEQISLCRPFSRAFVHHSSCAPQVLTIDPVNPGGVPLQNWNQKEISRFCPHCAAAKDQSTWSDHVEFLHEAPTSPEALAVVEKRVSAVVARGLPVLVMEDSDHVYEHVVDNIFAYARFVTPGSYLIVQDMRTGKFVGPTRAVERFLAAQAEGEEGQRRHRQDGRNRSWRGHFERDRPLSTRSTMEASFIAHNERR
eukprot:5793392-Prymnesium_polylepis.1